MGVPLHETEKNFIRFGVVHFNRANKLGLDDTAVAAITPETRAGLQTKISALNIHETEANFERQINRTIDKLGALKTLIGKPGIPTLATAATGGTIPDATTVFVVVTAIDEDGVESLPGPEETLELTGDGGDDNTLTIKSLAALNGAASYRIYIGEVETGVYELGYKADADKDVETSGGVTLTALDTGLTAGTPPTTSIAKVAALSQTEVAAAVATGTFAALLSKLTADDSTVDSTLDRGGQVTT